MAEKNGFNITKLIVQFICVTEVQWSRSSLHVLIYRVRPPSDAVFCFFVPFFFVWSLFFNTISFWPVFLYSYSWPCWSCTWINIYFKLLRVLFLKRDFKSSWSAYWPSLRPEKNICCQDMFLLWDSWIFFNVRWHHDKQHTIHHKPY